MRYYPCFVVLLGVRAEETLLVGDDLRTDILGAKGLGMRTVWTNPRG